MNKQIILIGVSALIGIPVLAQTNKITTLPPPGYKLVWSDEFNGDALDTNQWDYRTDSKMWSTQSEHYEREAIRAAIFSYDQLWKNGGRWPKSIRFVRRFIWMWVLP